MQQAKTCISLIVDVRNNTGGTRHLIMELAKYFVHPDLMHVVNIARQRGELTLNAEFKESLNYRFF